MSCKISDICEINKDNISKKDSYSYINYLDTANLNEGRIDEIKKLKVGEDKIPSRAKRKVKKDDILISTVRPNQKHYGIIKDNEIENLIVSTGFAVLSPKSMVNGKYLYNYLTLPHITEYLQGVAETSTTAYPSITPAIIGNLELDLPPLEEQEKIANILSSLDDKIELNNEMNKTLEEMAQALFKRWFVDFEFPNENGEPYKSSGGEMVESELGMIPKGWEVGTLGDMVEINSGKRPKKKSKERNEVFNIPLIGASSIMGYTNNVLYEERILVIGRVGTHGIVQRFNEKVWPSDNTLVIKTEYYEYMNQILSVIDYKALNVGSTQPLITQTDIKNVEILLPEKIILNQFELLVKSVYDIVNTNIVNINYLIELRDTLLPKLMSGEISLK